MTDLSISIPDGLAVWVSERVNLGDFNSPSDYVAQLINQDQQRGAKLRHELDRGLESGISPMTAHDIVARAKSRTNHGKLITFPNDRT